MKTALKILFVVNLVCVGISIGFHIIDPIEWTFVRMIRNVAISSIGAAISYAGWRV